MRLSNRGKLYVYSIVHRSFPGSRSRTSPRSSIWRAAARVKGNLINVEPDPKKIRFGMPVEVVYKDALGRKDSEGNAYLSYFFQPRRARSDARSSR